jgi:hypothetical protein
MGHMTGRQTVYNSTGNDYLIVKGECPGPVRGHLLGRVRQRQSQLREAHQDHPRRPGQRDPAAERSSHGREVIAASSTSVTTPEFHHRRSLH